MSADVSLNLTNVTVLSVGTEPVRFDSEFRFGTRKNIVVEVAEIGDNGLATGGVGICAENADALRRTGDWIKLTLNGIEVPGRAQLINFSLQEGTWVSYTRASLEFQIFEEGDLKGQFTDSWYRGLGELKASAKSLEDFSESFNFERSPDSTTYTYSITLKFSPDIQITTTDDCLPGEVSKAYECAREIIKGGASSRPPFALIDDEVKDLYEDYGKGKKRLLSEAVDLINKTCTFTERFTAYNIEDATYSSVIRQAITLDENGIVSIKENGTLKGLDTKTNLEIQSATPDPEDEIAQAQDATASGRLVKMFNFYKSIWNCPDLDDLVVDPDEITRLLIIKKGTVHDTFKGEARYDITVTNDQRYKNWVIHEYTITTAAVRGEKGNIYTATESGSLTGKTIGEVEVGEDTDEDGKVSWIEVKKAWVNLLGSNGFVEPDLGGTPRIKEILNTPSPRLVTNNVTKSPWKVKISYNQMVSEELKFRENDGVAKSITLRESKNYSLRKNKVGTVINHPDDKQLLQKRLTHSLGSVSAQVEMVGKRESSLDQLLTLATTKLNDAAYWPNNKKPQDSRTYIEGCNYTFTDDNDIKLNVNIGWK
jgi:hypothetical protein